MGRTRVFSNHSAKHHIRNLHEKKAHSEKRKKELISYLERLKQAYHLGQLPHERYAEIIHTKRQGRTIEEWIHYYHHEALATYKEIHNHLKKKSRRRFLTFLSFSVLIIFLVSFFGFAPLGFVLQDDDAAINLTLKEFTQELGLTLNTTTVHELEINERGNLSTLTLSGSIQGDGLVKIYFEDILAIDSSQLNQVSSGTRSIIGFSIDNETTEDESYSDELNEEESSQTEDSSPSQGDSPSSSEETRTLPELDINLTQPIEETNDSYSDELNESETLESEDSSPSPAESPSSVSDEEPTIVKTFEQYCKETCNINLPLTKDVYELRIEIPQGVVVNLDSINYKILMEESNESETRETEGTRDIQQDTSNLLPTADGNYGQWTPTSGSHYTNVDDPVGTPDDASTVVAAGEDGYRDSYTFQDLGQSGVTINNVTITARLMQDGTGVHDDITVFYRESSTDYDNPSAVQPATSFTNYQWVYTTNPATSSAWTLSEIDAMEWGIKFEAIDWDYMYLTQFYVTVDYSGGVPEPPINTTSIIYDDCNSATINSSKFSSQTTSGDEADVYATGTGYYVLDSANDASELTIHTSGLKDNFTKFTTDAWLDEDLGNGRGWHLGIGTGSLNEQTVCNTNTGYSPSNGYFVCFKGNNGGTFLVRVDSGVQTTLASNANNVPTDGYYNYTIELNDSGVFVYIDDTSWISSSDTTYSQGYITLSTGGGTSNRGNMSVNNVWDYETIPGDATPPTVTNLFPSAGAIYNVSNPINISAIVTDTFSGVNYTYINVTFPNATIIKYPLSNTAGNTYSYEFSDLTQKGIYNIAFFANDSLGNANNTETTWLNRTVPGNEAFDLIDEDLGYINYTSAILSDIGGIQTIEINISQPGYKIQRIVLSDHSSTSPYSVIRLANRTNDNASFSKTFMIDLDNANLTQANITINATGNYLFKCSNFSKTTLQCNSEIDYNQIKTNLIPGQLYTITLNKTDPIFGETLQGPGNTTDSYIRGGAATSNFGGATNIRVGKNTAAGNPIRGVIWFNISELNIPSNAIIEDANLSLYFYTIPGSDTIGTRTHNIHRINDTPARPWTELNVTWNNYNESDTWTNAGGDYISAVSASATFDNASLNSWINYSVINDIQNFVNGSLTNYGWIIKDSNEATLSTRRDYHSSEFTTSSLHPKLDIIYSLPSIPPNATIQTPVNGDKYQANTSILFVTNIKDDYNEVDTVLFMVEFPNTSSANYTPQHPSSKIIDGTMTDWYYFDTIGTDPDESNVTIPNDFDLKEAFMSHNDTDLMLRFDIYGTTPNGIDIGTYFYDFFVDSDMNMNTGYNQSAIPGGYDYLVENGNIYNYSGTGGAWGWTSSGTVPYAISADESSMEIIVSKQQIERLNATDIKLFFSLSDGANTDYFPNSNPYIYNYTKYIYEFVNTENLGNHNFTIYANDTDGDVNNTEKVSFDVIQLYTNISSPQNTTYTDATILVNITSDGVSTWYNFNDNPNKTYTAPVNDTFGTYSNTLYAYTNDSAGNLNYSLVTFYVTEAVNPSVTNVYPVAGRNYSLEKIVKIQADVFSGSPVDAVLAELTYPNTSIVNLTMKKTIPKTIDGNMSDWINTESVGSDQDEILINETYDLEEAFIANNGSDLFFRTDYYGDINFSFPAFYDILIDIDRNSSTGWDKENLWNYGYEYLVENGNLYSYNQTADGWNWIFISAVDYAVSPDLRSMEIRVPRALINDNNVSNILFAAGPGNITTSDFIPNGPDINTFFFRFYNEFTYKTILNDTGATGVYNITIIANNSAGLVNNTETTWFNVTGDIIPPGVTLIAPYEDQNFSINNVTFTCDVTDDIQLKNVTLYTNIFGGWQPYSTTNVSGKENSSSWTITNIPNGIYNWNCLAYDTSNNSKMYEENWTFRIFGPPEVIQVSSIANINPVESSSTSVTFYTTVCDGEGVSTLNDTSIKANFTRAGQATRANNTCTLVSDINSTCANYSCSIDMWYFDEAGDWNVSVYAKDLENYSAVNTSSYFQYNLLQALAISPDNINFGVSSNTFNQSANNDPVTINNTGNYNITNRIAINAINLLGETTPSESINAENFSVNTADNCAGSRLQNNTDINITGIVLEAGNLSLGSGTAQEQLYYCLNEVGAISTQTYSTQTGGAWFIKIVLSLAIITTNSRKKKKKSKKRQVLVEDLSLPITIFTNKLGGLEGLSKYLKENLGLTYHEIAELINRDDRTIWTSYNKSVKKQPTRLIARKTLVYIPASIFKNRKYTILESIVVYLKNKGMKYVDIAKLLDRDQRNVWTIYNRSIRK